MYRWSDHTGELGLKIEATSEAGVFEEALAALGELLGGEAGGGPADGESVSRRVEAAAPDRPALLAAWLEELLFLAESERLVPERVARLDLTDTGLVATIEARRGSPRPLVKAATYHRLSFRREGDAWRATVVLDV